MATEPLSRDDYEPSADELDDADAAYDAWVRDEATYAVRRAWWADLYQGIGRELPADAEHAAVDELLEGGGDLDGEIDADGAPDVWVVWKTDPIQALARVLARLIGSVRNSSSSDFLNVPSSKPRSTVKMVERDRYRLTPIEARFYKALRETGLSFAVQPWIQGTDRRYRLDFLVFYDGRAFAVELDGHDSHKTKEQRGRDAARDRWFAARKVATLRFTGSQVFADPQGCVSELQDILRGASARP